MINDTIVAIATPFGKSALGIVRLSGKDAINIASMIFYDSAKHKNVKEFNGYTLHVGHIRDDKRHIDDVIMGIMKEPNSYTGEDIIEFICHGNIIIMHDILNLCIANGARCALPGEFTKRSFLNGKIDLSQAEAVNQLINARSEKSREEALKIMEGDLREEIKLLKEKLFRVKTNIDSDIEWGETEQINTKDKDEIINILKDIRKHINNILENSVSVTKLLNGFRVVICGKPNSGKSSLFNCLLKNSRSIISSEPGTTRDVIDCEMIIEGYVIKLIDTAGLGIKLRSKMDRLASEKSAEEINKADIIIYMIDGKTDITRKDLEIKKMIGNREWVPVINKCDLKIKLDQNKLAEFCGDKQWYQISCKEQQGLFNVIERIKNILSQFDDYKTMVTSRQREAFSKACDNIKNAVNLAQRSEYAELISYEVQETINNLGRIDGSFLEEDILDRIFSEFCIGK